MSKIYYTDEHEWLNVEGDVATVGITNHAQEQLGDLVFVDLPDVGDELEQGDDGVVVESVKAASDVYAPASGTVVEVNEKLNDDAALVNAGAEKVGGRGGGKPGMAQAGGNNVAGADDALAAIKAAI